MRGKDKSPEHQEKWSFGLIAEVTERVWIVWVLKRMREAMEEKVGTFHFLAWIEFRSLRLKL